MNKPQRTVAEGCFRSHVASYAPRRKKMIAMDSGIFSKAGSSAVTGRGGRKEDQKNWGRGLA